MTGFDREIAGCEPGLDSLHGGRFRVTEAGAVCAVSTQETGKDLDTLWREYIASVEGGLST